MINSANKIKTTKIRFIFVEKHPPAVKTTVHKEKKRKRKTSKNNFLNRNFYVLIGLAF